MLNTPPNKTGMHIFKCMKNTNLDDILGYKTLLNKKDSYIVSQKNGIRLEIDIERHLEKIHKSLETKMHTSKRTSGSKK